MGSPAGAGPSREESAPEIVMIKLGYKFRHPELDEALDDLL